MKYLAQTNNHLMFYGTSPIHERCSDSSGTQSKSSGTSSVTSHESSERKEISSEKDTKSSERIHS